MTDTPLAAGLVRRVGKLSLKYAREWSNDRVQWGAPIGKHEAVALQLADIAAKTYAMDAVVELSSMLADEERNDIRLEAALAKLFCSEAAWQVADEMVQIGVGAAMKQPNRCGPGASARCPRSRS